MEAPIIRIPDTEQNRRNISHPLLDSDGRILSKFLQIAEFSRLFSRSKISLPNFLRTAAIRDGTT